MVNKLSHMFLNDVNYFIICASMFMRKICLLCICVCVCVYNVYFWVCRTTLNDVSQESFTLLFAIELLNCPGFVVFLYLPSDGITKTHQNA